MADYKQGKFNDLSPTLQEVVTAAVKAKDLAYRPYGKFNVGAALLCDNGQIISGCNVENASLGLTICAERVALVKACSEGHRKFKAIAVVCDVPDRFVGLCGACRQFIVEFGTDWDIYVIKLKNLDWKLFKVSDLLPHSFGPNDEKR